MPENSRDRMGKPDFSINEEDLTQAEQPEISVDESELPETEPQEVTISEEELAGVEHESSGQITRLRMFTEQATQFLDALDFNELLEEDPQLQGLLIDLVKALEAISSRLTEEE